jgi:hypothetical protein
MELGWCHNKTKICNIDFRTVWQMGRKLLVEAGKIARKLSQETGKWQGNCQRN